MNPEHDAARVGRRRLRALGALAASFVACLVVVVGPAVVAQEEASPLAIRRVDASDPKAVAVDLIWTGQVEALADLTVREEGKERPHDPARPLSAAGVARGMVVVVDTSRSMATNGGVRQTQETLRTMIAELDDGEPMGIVSFGSEVEVLSDLTTDKDQLLEATDELVAPAEAETAMWDGLRRGASLFAGQEDIQANLVLITDGYDDASETTAEQAASEVARVGGAVFALAYGAQNQDDTEALTALVDRVGGAVIRAPGEEDLAEGLVDVQASLDHQYRVVFASTGAQGAADLEITVGDASAKTTFVSGAVSEGQANLAPPAASRSLIPGFARGTIGLVLAVGVGALAVVLVLLALLTLVSNNEQNLDRMLQQYTDPGSGDLEGDEGLVQTAFVQRAVDFTEEIATKQGFLVKIESKLEAADLPLRAAEALFFYVMGASVVTVLGGILGGIVGLAAGALVGFAVPMAVLNFLGARRRKQFETQLPDMLQLLAGSLRAGYSLVQGVDAVSAEVDGPMGRELRRVMTEARLGRELEDALEASALRVQSKDFEWAIMAVRIQREVGGNLSELLITVSDTMVDRERLRRDVATLTAEGKISAIILGFMPLGLGAVMYTMNPDYMRVLFTESLGKILLGAGTASALIGFAWMKKCITIEV